MRGEGEELVEVGKERGWLIGRGGREPRGGGGASCPRDCSLGLTITVVKFVILVQWRSQFSVRTP